MRPTIAAFTQPWNSLVLYAEASGSESSHNESGHHHDDHDDHDDEDHCAEVPRGAACRTICTIVADSYPIGDLVVSSVQFLNQTLTGTHEKPISWRVKLFKFGFLDAATFTISKRSVTTAWIDGNGNNECDVFVGSGLADIDESLIGVIRVPWLEPFISTSVLTNRVEFPNVLNLLPRVTQVASRFLGAFSSIDTWSIVSLSDATSRGWKAAALQHWAKVNATIAVTREISTSAGVGDVKVAVDALMASRARYVFFAASAFDVHFHLLLAELKAQHFFESKIGFFIDEVCTASPDIANHPGAFCVDYETVVTRPGEHDDDHDDDGDHDDGDDHGDHDDDHRTAETTRARRLPRTARRTVRKLEEDDHDDHDHGHEAPAGMMASNYTAYLAYRAANMAAVNRTLAPYNLRGSEADGFLNAYFSTMTHDAVALFMLVAHQRAMAGNTTPPSISDLRNATLYGTAGALTFGADGVRPDIPLALRNTHEGGSLETVAELHVGETEFEGWLPLFMLGRETTHDFLPAAQDAIPTSSSSNTALIIGVAVGAAVLVVVVVVAFALLIRANLRVDSRDHRNAPKDGSIPFTIAFTDIQASTALWASCPQAMSKAVEKHHEIIRVAITTHNGYEVKTIGDSFMVAFQHPDDGVAFALHLQEQFYGAEWAPELDRVYEAMAKDQNLPAAASDSALWGGLRVRVGLHCGTGSVILDPTTKGYDYYGTVVNTAARVETVANGGQVLVTADVLGAVMDIRETLWLASMAEITDLGAQPLRGLDKPVPLTQLLPTTFADRAFPPLRLDRIDEDECDFELSMSPEASLSHARRSVVSADQRGAGESKSSGKTYIAARQDSPNAAFMRTILSPLSDTDKAHVLALLVQKWHVNTTSRSETLMKNTAAFSSALRAVTARAEKAHSNTVGDEIGRRASRASGQEMQVTSAGPSACIRLSDTESSTSTRPTARHPSQPQASALCIASPASEGPLSDTTITQDESVLSKPATTTPQSARPCDTLPVFSEGE